MTWHIKDNGGRYLNGMTGMWVDELCLPCTYNNYDAAEFVLQKYQQDNHDYKSYNIIEIDQLKGTMTMKNKFLRELINEVLQSAIDRWIVANDGEENHKCTTTDQVMEVIESVEECELFVYSKLNLKSMICWMLIIPETDDAEALNDYSTSDTGLEDIIHRVSARYEEEV